MNPRKHVPYDQRFGPWDDNYPKSECAPSFTLDREIERGKLEMGEARWNELNALWEGK